MSVVTKDADNLLGGAVVTDDRFPLKIGENLKRGDLLEYFGKKMAKAAVAANVVAVLVEDVDATTADKRCAYYVAGSSLYEKGLLLGVLDADDVYKSLLSNGIVVKG